MFKQILNLFRPKIDPQPFVVSEQDRIAHRKMSCESEGFVYDEATDSCIDPNANMINFTDVYGETATQNSSVADSTDNEDCLLEDKRSNKNDTAMIVAAAIATLAINKYKHNDHKETYDQRCNRELDRHRNNIRAIKEDTYNRQKEQVRLHSKRYR